MGKMDGKIVMKKKKNKYLSKKRQKYKATDLEVVRAVQTKFVEENKATDFEVTAVKTKAVQRNRTKFVEEGKAADFLVTAVKAKAFQTKCEDEGIDDEEANVNFDVCPITKKNKRSKRTRKQLGFQLLDTVEATGVKVRNLFRSASPVSNGENTLDRFLRNAELVAVSLDKNCDDRLNFDDDLEITGSIKLSPIAGGEIVVVDANSTIYVYGLVEITVVFGTVEIFGKTLKRTDKVKVYSPRGASFLSIVNRGESVDEEELRAYDCSLGSAVLECRKIEETATKFLEENSAQILYPNNKDGTRWHLRNYVKRNWNTFKYNEEWEAIIAGVTVESKVMLFGGKGVGKSTLLRYLVNRLLDRYGEVCVVDLDPGQSEFTVPGCVSIVKIDEPLLGPSYTHLRQPDKCIFVPDISVTSDLKTYLSAAKSLIAHLHRSKGVPTLINTMGYTKGMGLNIAEFLIDHLRPTTVVQIDKPDDAASNFECDLRPRGFRYDFVKVVSVSSYQSNWKMMPRQIRELSLYSYFSRVLPDGCDYLTDKRVTIYRVDLNDVAVVCNGAECSPTAANANVVALCTRDFTEDECRLFECVGWGIVRGLSTEYGYLAILTPVPRDMLEDVRYLVVGSVTLPPSIYLRNHGSVYGLVPHVYKGELRDFAKIPKRTFAGQLET